LSTPVVVDVVVVVVEVKERQDDLRQMLISRLATFENA